jgi:hypothetical protein
MKLESTDSAETKQRWKVVRCDDYTDVPGEIIAADEATGECRVQVAGQETPQDLRFPGGIRIALRRR